MGTLFEVPYKYLKISILAAALVMGLATHVLADEATSSDDGSDDTDFARSTIVKTQI